mmetsp:Transcript_57358/g.124632  ORF Transcript_57358/g.124632 Transcript_57358/m.124632 type:complete len:297 (+) Transcript_57358:507-1397(+)
MSPSPQFLCRRHSSAEGSLASGLKNGAASAVATICAKAALQPFDTLKTLQQASTASSSLFSVCAERVRSHGVLSLYRGLGVSFIGAVPAISAYFAVYSSLKGTLLARVNAPPLLLVAISAAMANTVGATLRVPCEIVKQRLQAGLYSSVSDAIGDLFGRGVGGMLPPDAHLAQLARDLPFGVVMLLTYESLKRQTRRALEGREPPPWLGALCGAAAGAVATIATNPMDVVKTRVMTAKQASSVLALVSAMWRDEGVTAFGKGVVPRLLHKIPASGVFWLLFELFRKLFRVDELRLQ